MSEELRPCPFCGGKAKTRHRVLMNTAYFTISCINPDCFLSRTDLAPCYKERSCIEAWNRRAENE